MSAGPPPSPAPGDNAGRPVWTREVPASQFAAGLRAGTQIIAFLYTAMTAWQVAKILCPGLQVREDLLIARLRRALRPPRPPEPVPPRAWVAELYDDTR